MDDPKSGVFQVCSTCKTLARGSDFFLVRPVLQARHYFCYQPASTRAPSAPPAASKQLVSRTCDSHFCLSLHACQRSSLLSASIGRYRRANVDDAAVAKRFVYVLRSSCSCSRTPPPLSMPSSYMRLPSSPVVPPISVSAAASPLPTKARVS